MLKYNRTSYLGYGPGAGRGLGPSDAGMDHRRGFGRGLEIGNNCDINLVSDELKLVELASEEVVVKKRNVSDGEEVDFSTEIIFLHLL